MAINNNSALSNAIAPVGNSKLSIQVGDMRLQSTYVFEGPQTPRYAQGWNVPITPSKGQYKSYVGFKALEGAGAEITHVRLCGELHEELQLIELQEPAILGQTLWSEMPQEVQDYYLKVVEEVAAKQSEKEQQIAQIEQKISEIFEKYPSAYVVFDLYGRTEKQEDDDYHTFSLYCPIETEWGPVEGYVYASRSQHRHGNVLLEELERAISKKIAILADQAALLAAHPNCYVENNKLYAKVEYKGVQKTLWLGNTPSCKEYEADLLRFKKSVDYQLQKEQEEKEFKAKWQARNEGVAAIILKRFPKAQIIKEPHYSGWWCVNTPRTDMLTFCKQNKLLVPKHLLP